MKRISFTLLMALLATYLPHPAMAATFPDVQGTHYQQAYTYLSNKNIVQGYSDGSGRPTAPINRVEALKVIVSGQSSMQSRLQWYQRTIPPLPLFTDVVQTEWYIPYLEVAFEQKVVTGYPDGTFKPGNPVTVEEAITMVVRTYNINPVSTFQQSGNIQNADGQWYTQFINTAISKNLISERERLYLGQPITRGQFFDILYRLDSIITSGEGSFASTNSNQSTNTTNSSFSVSNTNSVPSSQTNSTAQNPYSSQGTTGGSYNHQYLSSKPFAITIPSVGIHDLAIVRPTSYSPDGLLEPLSRGVGHLFSFPGGGGKIMVYGHSSSFPWDTSDFTKIFRKINEANPGDKIYVTYNGQVFTYEVAFEETIPAEDTSRFNDDGSGEKLILYTCWPPDSITQRYLVHAVPVQ